MLVISLLVPYPAIVAAQEAASAPEEGGAPTTSEETTSLTENAVTSETAEESLSEESASVEPEEDKGDEEPPPQGLLDEEQDPDPAYGDERAPQARQPVVEPDQLDGSLRYLHPLTIPPGRSGLEPDLALVYLSRPDEQISPFGYGWSINIPYIERVNRYGVDRLYDTYEFYSSLDGDLASTTGGGGGIGDLADEEAAFFNEANNSLVVKRVSREDILPLTQSVLSTFSPTKPRTKPASRSFRNIASTRYSSPSTAHGYASTTSATPRETSSIDH
jgi:hypothetical protein